MQAVGGATVWVVALHAFEPLPRVIAREASFKRARKARALARKHHRWPLEHLTIHELPERKAWEPFLEWEDPPDAPP